jgi:hypothetical protein
VAGRGWPLKCLGVPSKMPWDALTLILLTWRIWSAPNNASKWQMGFNSAFKGLRVRRRRHYISSMSRAEAFHHLSHSLQYKSRNVRFNRKQVKVKLSLCMTHRYIGEWRYSSTNQPRQKMDDSGHIHSRPLCFDGKFLRYPSNRRFCSFESHTIQNREEVNYITVIHGQQNIKKIKK